MIIEAQQYIRERCEPIPWNGCWIWLISTDVHDYGQACFRGKQSTASRLSFQAFIGEIGQKSVLHTCDIPVCVNPDHLYLGTQADNMKDVQNRDRSKGINSGEKCNTAKLSWPVVDQIRKEHKQGATPLQLSNRNPVSVSTIRRIINGVIWKECYR